MESFATRAYVVGEIMISIVVLIGSFILVYYGAETVRLVGAGLLPVIMVFWFQRRSAESSAGQIVRLADVNNSQAQAENRQVANQVSAAVTLVGQAALQASRAQTGAVSRNEVDRLIAEARQAGVIEGWTAHETTPSSPPAGAALLPQAA